MKEDEDEDEEEDEDDEEVSDSAAKTEGNITSYTRDKILIAIFILRVKLNQQASVSEVTTI